MEGERYGGVQRARWAWRSRTRARRSRYASSESGRAAGGAAARGGAAYGPHEGRLRARDGRGHRERAHLRGRGGALASVGRRGRCGRRGGEARSGDGRGRRRWRPSGECRGSRGGRDRRGRRRGCGSRRGDGLRWSRGRCDASGYGDDGQGRDLFRPRGALPRCHGQDDDRGSRRLHPPRRRLRGRRLRPGADPVLREQPVPDPCSPQARLLRQEP